jgi:hypothetical protein
VKKRHAKTNRLTAAIVTAAVALVVATAARAADPAYLEQLPSVATVLAENQGQDALDTKARQRAAFNQWARAVGFLAGEREFCCQTADEQRLVGEYRTAASDIEKEMRNTLSTAEPSNPFRRSEYQQWTGRASTYEKNVEFRSASFRRHLNGEPMARLDAAYTDWDRRFYGESSTPSRLDEMDEGTRALVTTGFMVLLGLIVLTLVREFLPFGSRGSNPLKIGAGFRLYTAHWASGHVTDYKRWTETVTTKTSDVDQYGNHSNVRFSSHTYVHESFTLVGANGSHPVHVVDAKIEIPEGHFTTAVWTKRRMRESGNYVLFFDRTSNVTKPSRYGIGDMLAPRLWILLPILFGAFVIGGMGLPIAFPDTFRSMSDTLVGLMSVFVMWIVTLIWINLVTIPKRTRRFLAKSAPRILAAIEKKEPAATSALVTPAA